MRYVPSIQTLSMPRVLTAMLAFAMASLLLLAPAANAGNVDLRVSVGIPIVYSGYDSQGYFILSTGYFGGGHGHHYYGRSHHPYGYHRHYVRPFHPFEKRHHLHYGRPFWSHGRSHHFYGNHDRRGHGGLGHNQFDRQGGHRFRGHRR